MARLALIVAQLIALASISKAACPRAELFKATQSFFAGTISQSGPRSKGDVQLAKNAQITENNVVVKSLNDTLYRTMLGLERAYQIEISDEGRCNIAKLFVAKEATGPAIASIRLRLSEAKATTIQEVEILKATNGSHEIFAPEAFPNNIPPLWRLSNPSALRKGERKNLELIANSYPEALQEGSNTRAIAAVDCPRLENGNQTTLHCGANMDLFKWPVTNRRWVVDTMTGAVMGSFFFNYKDGKGKLGQTGGKNRGPDSKVGLWLHEYFRIVDGKIVEIVAAMKTLPANYEDVWGEE